MQSGDKNSPLTADAIETTAAGLNESVISERAEEIRSLGRQYGLSPNRIEECFKRAVKDVCEREQTNTNASSTNCRWQPIVIAIAIVIVGYWLLACHKPTQTFVSRHVQDLIYPCMRLLRLSTLWLHQRFPQITVWHEEQCLIDNPWYRNLDLSCWPCEEIRTVTDLTSFPHYVEAYLHNGIPFIVKDGSSSSFTLGQLEKLYSENEAALVSGTGYFRSNIPSLRDLKDILEPGKSHKLYEYNKIHIEWYTLQHNNLKILKNGLNEFWQLKRVSAARVMRKLFPRAHFVPNNTEVALERYLFIDGPSALSYSIQLTEFANVWLSQRVGRRVVTFQPSPHCQHSCSPISTVIFAGDILFYNWQYWRLQFHPSATSLSLTYMGSFY